MNCNDPSNLYLKGPLVPHPDPAPPLFGRGGASTPLFPSPGTLIPASPEKKLNSCVYELSFHLFLSVWIGSN